MEVYFDLENFISFYKQKDSPLFDECHRALKKQLTVNVNFSKKHLLDNPVLIEILKFFTHGVKKDLIFKESPFPERPLKTNCYNSFDIKQLNSIYLLNEENTNKLKEKGALLVGTIGEEVSVISSIFLKNDDYVFSRLLKIGGEDFRSWKDLEKFALPLSDLIIVDPYLLSSDENLNNLLDLLEANLAVVKSKINLLIYTNKNHLNVNWSEAQTKIRNKVSSITSIKPNITLIEYRSQRGLKSFEEHDRTILANYCRYYSGDSFCYFNREGEKITTGRELNIAGLALEENSMLAEELVADLQNNINKIPSEQILGDKKSNFIVFK